jgi:hypothetical protein
VAHPMGHIAQCNGFLNNMLPEDGPVWLKHVVHKYQMYIYFSGIFKHFNEQFSKLNVD